jgi:type II secretory ATPase GspE/PulE/Tfp pilus assembly ATPase PilB-like protein
MEQSKHEIPVASVAPIIAVAHAIIEQAIDAHASEIQLLLLEDRMEVYNRVGEHLHRWMTLPARIYPNLVTRYKVMADVSWASRQLPVDGHISIRRRGRQYDIAVTFPVRLLDPRLIMTITPGPESVGDEGNDPV